MAFKLFVLAACLAAASAGVIPAAPLAYSAPLAHAPLAYAAPAAYPAPATLTYSPVAKTIAAPVIAKAPVAVDTDFDPNPSYNYEYSIHDALTGDAKSQQESRQGDVVQGSYSLVEPDGSRRTVEYTADPVNGFNAVVHKDGAVAAAPVAYAAPIAKVASPVAYASPALLHH